MLDWAITRYSPVITDPNRVAAVKRLMIVSTATKLIERLIVEVCMPGQIRKLFGTLLVSASLSTDQHAALGVILRGRLSSTRNSHEPE